MSKLPPFDPDGRCPYCGSTERQNFSYHPPGPALSHLWDFFPGFDQLDEEGEIRPTYIRGTKPCSLAQGAINPNTFIDEHMQRSCGKCGAQWAEQCWKDLPEQQAWATFKRKER